MLAQEKQQRQWGSRTRNLYCCALDRVIDNNRRKLIIALGAGIIAPRIGWAQATKRRAGGDILRDAAGGDMHAGAGGKVRRRLDRTLNAMEQMSQSGRSCA